VTLLQEREWRKALMEQKVPELGAEQVLKPENFALHQQLYWPPPFDRSWKPRCLNGTKAKYPNGKPPFQQA